MVYMVSWCVPFISSTHTHKYDWHSAHYFLLKKKKALIFWSFAVRILSGLPCLFQEMAEYTSSTFSFSHGYFKFRSVLINILLLE